MRRRLGDKDIAVEEGENHGNQSGDSRVNTKKEMHAVQRNKKSTRQSAHQRSQRRRAIDQSQRMDQIEAALVLGLKRLVSADASQDSTELLSTLDAIGSNQAGSDLLALSDLFNQISALGEAEQKACLQILKVFASYQRSLRRTWA